MPALVSLPLLWSQVPHTGLPEGLKSVIQWLVLLGEPELTIPGFWGGPLTWIKVLSLFSLLGWVVSWVTTALKERTALRGNWLDIAALAALVVGLVAMVLNVMEATGRWTDIPKIGKIPLAGVLGVAAGGTIFVWVETVLWKTIRRLGKTADVVVLSGMHVGLVLGIGVGIGFNMVLQESNPKVVALLGASALSWQQGVINGARFGATYMGYVVLVRVIGLVFRELLAVRWRRLYSIATLSIIESNRRMWAPWVVITVFLVVLAFTHWFLQPPRPAEMGRLFVGTLALLCSLLLTVMVTLLTPLSLPTDIQQQTIYTVVSKPVRRIELIWGRMIGFMTIVTFLVLVFGGISLAYLWRTVGGQIAVTEREAVRLAGLDRTVQANHLREEAAQLRVRMSAREPVRGSLSFIDSKGNPHSKGIDVGSDQGREPRSHIEGATPSAAIWRFGRIPDPYDPEQRAVIDRVIPVSRLLERGSIEHYLDQVETLKSRIASAEQAQARGNLAPADVQRLTATLARDREQLRNVESAYGSLKAKADELLAGAQAAAKEGRATEAETLRRQALALHSPPIPVEMSFNVYRTTKGRVGDPVLAEMQVTNPFSSQPPIVKIFPIREYYTNRQYLPAEILAGSHGALQIEVRCLSPTQYLGMAERDLYLLASAGDFGTNYMKGLFGVWLQAMVLTAIGVFAGTFLSWPVALLTTIAFFVAGQVAFAFLIDFGRQAILGGGPFESLIRLLTHDNQMTELAPTMAVVTAKTFDSIVMPVMSRLVYIVPNFGALDVSNTVADGYEVRWALLGSNLLLALAYALPFSIAGYFILKNREVAA